MATVRIASQRLKKFAKMIFREGDAPATPVTGELAMYAKSTGLYTKDSNGTETFIGGATPGEVEFEKVTVDNLVIDGNDISSSSGDITLSPKAGSDVVVDGHWEFDGPALAALTDNNTTITAYAGKNITIESVTFDGGVVGGVSSIDIDGGTIDGATIGATTAGTLRSLLVEDAEIVTAEATLTANQCSGGLISNYNQSLDCTVTVPTAFAGGNFIVALSTAVAKYYRLDPTGSEVWVWDGVAQAAGKYIGVAAATVGAALQFIALQTGASAWTWHVYTVAGSWAVEG